MDYAEMSQKAAERATECSKRGDTEGSFYNRGLRDAYAMVAAFPDEPKLPPEIAVAVDRAVGDINAVLATLEPGIQVGFDATPVGRPEASPAGEMRERDVPCQTCRRRQTWNWSAVCDYCKAR